MFPAVNITDTVAWQKLTLLYAAKKNTSIQSLFADNSNRFAEYSILDGDILFDFSKNNIDNETLAQLIALANECELPAAIQAMFGAEKINKTENRAVLHTALRNNTATEIWLDGKNIVPDINEVKAQMKQFCTDVHSGSWRGYTGKKIKYIVNIGIGGSDLGPVMVTEALKPYWIPDVDAHFVSNVDGTHIAETLKKIKAEETLFLIASKTFTTQETMTNAYTAKAWLLSHGATEADVAKHFVALSTNTQAVASFGIDTKNIFVFWDWVGGRYSLWSAIGLSIALTIGYDNWDKLLQGAAEADKHFSVTDYNKNIPVLMALVGIWNRNFYNTPTEAILPYDQYLRRFAAYFQQANMESNGKYIDRNGQKVNYATGPVIWGEPGTNGQHAFYQLIHQGTQIIPVDFIAPAISHNPIADHHALLLSNFFAQSEALMNGATNDNIYRVFEGNRPSNSFLLKRITPYTLGQLTAFYEHKIFVQGVLWNIYSFDQWGVELGKKLAVDIQKELASGQIIKSHDSSTNGLINAYKQWSLG